jgi:hypothetical protein
MEKTHKKLMKIFIKNNFFILIFSFVTIVVLFRLLFTLIIFHFNIPQFDDFCFMAKMNDYGILGSINWWYLNWQGRFLPQLLTNLILFHYEKYNSFFLYGVIKILLFSFSLYRIFYFLLIRFKIILNKVDNFIVFIFSILIFFLFLDFHIDTSTFYWINVSTMYFVGMAFLLLGTSELLNPSKSYLSYTILSFSFFYVGCSSEHVALLVIFLLFMLFFLNRFFIQNFFSLNKHFFAFLFCLISFFIMYFAPGNSIRISGTIHPTLLKAIKNIPIFFNILYFNRLSLNFGYLIFSFFFSFAFASFFSNRIRINPKQLKKILILVFIILCYFVIGTITIFSFLLDYKGSTRAFVHISLFISLFFVLLGFVFGFFISPVQKKLVNSVFLMLAVIYASTVLYKFKFNLRPTIKYEISVRGRLIDITKNIQSSSSIKIVPRLINDKNNILLNGELASSIEDSTFFVFNKCLISAFRLNSKKIILVDQKINIK